MVAVILCMGYVGSCLGQLDVQSDILPMPSVVAKSKEIIGGTGLLHAVRKAHIQSLQAQHAHLPDTPSWYAQLARVTWTPLLGVYNKHFMLHNLPKKETPAPAIFLNNPDTKTIFDDNIELYLGLIKKLGAKKARADVSQKEREQLEREIGIYNKLLNSSLEQRINEMQDKKWNETVEQREKRLQQLPQELEYQMNVYKKDNKDEFALQRLKLLRDMYKSKK